MVDDQPYRPLAARVIKPILLCIACLTTVVLILGIAWFYITVNFRAYNTLNFGMDIAEVEEILDQPLDYSCRFRSYTVYYFFNRGSYFDEDIASLEDKSLFPEAVESKEDLPYVYAAKQVMVNSEGLVVAYTWMGEEYDIHTAIGDFPGAMIKELPNEFFDSLNNQDE